MRYKTEDELHDIINNCRSIERSETICVELKYPATELRIKAQEELKKRE